MAEKPAGLGDFFAAKRKKKIKALNLNAPNQGQKEEDSPQPKSEKQAGNDKNAEWNEAEETAAAPIAKMELGNLTKEEEEEEEVTRKKAWGGVKTATTTGASASKWSSGGNQNLQSAKKYPSLQTANESSGAYKVGREDDKARVDKKSNVFAELADSGDESGGEGRKRNIVPALLSKKQGEREDEMVDNALRAAGKTEEPMDPKEAAELEKKREERRARKEEKKAARPDKDELLAGEPEEEQRNQLPDELIEPDMDAVAAKYVGRRKKPRMELPKSEQHAAPGEATKSKIRIKKYVTPVEDKVPKKMVEEMPDGW